MPSFCFFDGVSMAANQTSVVKGLRPDKSTLSFQVTTRTGAGVQVLIPTGVHVTNREFTFSRVRWDLATTTVFIDGSNTLRADEWTPVGSLAIVVGLATALTVTLG